MAKEVYRAALQGIDDLVAPYAAVVDIDRGKLPRPQRWTAGTSDAFVAAIRHVKSEPRFNPNMRQLVHVAFKVAAKMGPRYLDALSRHEASVSRNVATNLWERHMKPLFLG